MFLVGRVFAKGGDGKGGKGPGLSQFFTDGGQWHGWQRVPVPVREARLRSVAAQGVWG